MQAVLRSRYGHAYVTGALDDLHANRAHSEVIALVGFDPAQRGSWASAQKLISGELEENGQRIRQGLERLAGQGYGRVMEVISRGGMSFGFDSFRDLVRRFREGLVSVALEGWRVLVDALLAAFRSFCNFLSQLFEGDEQTLASIEELKLQADTRQGWLSAPLQALSWLWNSAWSYVRVIASMIAAAVDGGAQFLGSAMKAFANISVVSPIRAVARQGLVLVFLAYNVMQDTLVIGKQNQQAVQEHIRAATMQWPQYILDLAATLSFGAGLLTNPLFTLMNTDLFRMLLGVVATGLSYVLDGVLYVLRTLAAFIRNLCTSAIHTIQQFLPTIITDQMTYINNVVGRLAAQVCEMLPVPNSVTGVADVLGESIQACEALQKVTAPSSHLYDVLEYALGEARAFEAEQVAFKASVVPTLQAAHDNARIMAAQFMGEHLFESDVELRARWALHSTGYSYESFLGRVQAIITLLDDALYGFVAEKLDDTDATVRDIYKVAPTTGMRRRKPNTVVVVEQQLIGNDSVPKGVTRAEKIAYCQERIIELQRTDRRYSICKELIEKRIEPVILEMHKLSDAIRVPILAKIRKSALFELDSHSGVQGWRDHIDKLRAADPWLRAFSVVKFSLQAMAVGAVIYWAAPWIKAQIVNAATADAWKTVNTLSERAGLTAITKDDPVQSLLLRKYKELLIAEDKLETMDVEELRRGFNIYQCAVIDRYQYSSNIDDSTNMQFQLAVKQLLGSRFNKPYDAVLHHLEVKLPKLNLKEYYERRVDGDDALMAIGSGGGGDLIVQQTKQIVGALYERYAERTGGEVPNSTWDTVRDMMAKVVKMQGESINRAWSWCYEKAKSKGMTGLDLPDLINISKLLENGVGGNTAYVVSWLSMGIGAGVIGYTLFQMILLVMGSIAAGIFGGLLGSDTVTLAWQNDRTPSLYKCTLSLVAAVALPVLVVQLVAWISIFCGAYLVTAAVASTFGFGAIVLSVTATVFDTVFRGARDIIALSRLPLSSLLGYGELDSDPDDEPAKRFRREYYHWLRDVYPAPPNAIAGLAEAHRLEREHLWQGTRHVESTAVRSLAVRQIEETKPAAAAEPRARVRSRHILTKEQEARLKTINERQTNRGASLMTPEKYLEEFGEIR